MKSNIHADVETLKQDFLSALANISGGITSLREAVVDLLDADISKAELLDWATEAGYSEQYIRSLLSQILISTGKRERKAGAGPTTPADAMALAELAVESFGSDAPKIVLACYRALKAGKVSFKKNKLRSGNNGHRLHRGA